MKDPQIRFNDILAEIAARLLYDVEEEAVSSWRRAYLDARWSRDGDARIVKCRVDCSDGREECPWSPEEVGQLLSDLWNLRDEAIVGKWYGLVMTVYPDHNAELEFNFDSNCAADPSFFGLADSGGKS